MSDLEEDCVIVSVSGKTALRDFPHVRHACPAHPQSCLLFLPPHPTSMLITSQARCHCIIHPLQSGKENLHCDQCFCGELPTQLPARMTPSHIVSLPRAPELCDVKVDMCADWQNHCLLTHDQVVELKKSTCSTPPSVTPPPPSGSTAVSYYQLDVEKLMTDLAKPRSQSFTEAAELIIQPPDITITLRPQQKQALYFLMSLRRDGKKGGILASHMGEGKTLVSAAFSNHVRTLPTTKRPMGNVEQTLLRGTTVHIPATLWIVPNTHIRQKHDEIRRAEPSASIYVWYEGSKRETADNLHQADHIITTPHMEWPWSIGHLNFELIVLDESHLMEKKAAFGHNQFFRLLQYRCRFMLLLTGTPYITPFNDAVYHQLSLLGQWDSGICFRMIKEDGLADALRRICFRSESNLVLPDLVTFEHGITMNQYEREMYLTASALEDATSFPKRLLACVGLRFCPLYQICNPDDGSITVWDPHLVSANMKARITPQQLCNKSANVTLNDCGLNWIYDSNRPRGGVQLENTRLTEALRRKDAHRTRNSFATSFTQREWTSFGINALRTCHYVQVTPDCFYRPLHNAADTICFTNLPAFGGKAPVWRRLLDPTSDERMTKYLKLEDILKQRSTERSVVFFRSHDVCAHVRRVALDCGLRFFNAAQAAATGRSTAISRFGEEYEEGSVLACRYLHASTGLNFTGGPRGVENIIFIETSDDSSSFMQAVKRVHRVGNSARRVAVHVIYYSDTMEVDIWKNATHGTHLPIGTQANNFRLKYVPHEHLKGPDIEFYDCTDRESASFMPIFAWTQKLPREAVSAKESDARELRDMIVNRSITVGRVWALRQCALTGLLIRVSRFNHFLTTHPPFSCMPGTQRASHTNILATSTGIVKEGLEWYTLGEEQDVMSLAHKKFQDLQATMWKIAVANVAEPIFIHASHDEGIVRQKQLPGDAFDCEHVICPWRFTTSEIQFGLPARTISKSVNVESVTVFSSRPWKEWMHELDVSSKIDSINQAQSFHDTRFPPYELQAAPRALQFDKLRAPLVKVVLPRIRIKFRTTSRQVAPPSKLRRLAHVAAVDAGVAGGAEEKNGDETDDDEDCALPNGWRKELVNKDRHVWCYTNGKMKVCSVVAAFEAAAKAAVSSEYPEHVMVSDLDDSDVEEIVKVMSDES